MQKPCFVSTTLENICFADAKDNDNGIMPLEIEQEYVSGFDADREILGGSSYFGTYLVFCSLL
jgi:hypothetical protein